MKENEKRLIDLTKMAETDDGEQPFIRVNYEVSAEENLEAIISNDEMVGYFEDFKAGKFRQKERLTNQSGIGVLQLIFHIRFYQRGTEKPSLLTPRPNSSSQASSAMLQYSLVEFKDLRIQNALKIAAK